MDKAIRRYFDSQALPWGDGTTQRYPRAMKAWQLEDTNGIDSYVLNDASEPEPGPGEVRVDIRFSGLNHLDIWTSMGLPAPKHMPHTTGADGAGIVDAVGDGVAGIEVDDEVIVDPSISCGACDYCRNDDIVYCSEFKILGEHAPGTFAEKVVVPAINLVPKPAAVDWETAGSFGLAAVTALRMLEKSRLKSGETVLVVGVGGGVSASAMSLAQALGATVYVTSRSPEKIVWAVENGAVAGFDSADEFGEEMGEAGGADLVIDNVGPATLKQSMRAAKPGGRIAICGATSSPKLELNLPVLWFKQLEFIGSSMGNHAQFSRALNWIRLGKASAPVARVFPFEELPDALRFLESGEQMGNVVLKHD